MDILIMHFCFSNIYENRDEDFLRISTFLLYGHIGPACWPEPLTKET